MSPSTHDYFATYQNFDYAATVRNALSGTLEAMNACHECCDRHALPGRIGWELRLIVLGGLRILECIETTAYDVFRHRPVLAKGDWLRLAWRALNYRNIA